MQYGYYDGSVVCSDGGWAPIWGLVVKWGLHSPGGGPLGLLSHASDSTPRLSHAVSRTWRLAPLLSWACGSGIIAPRRPYCGTIIVVARQHVVSIVQRFPRMIMYPQPVLIVTIASAWATPGVVANERGWRRLDQYIQGSACIVLSILSRGLDSNSVLTSQRQRKQCRSWSQTASSSEDSCRPAWSAAYDCAKV